MAEKLTSCSSSLSFQYPPQPLSGCSAMNLPVHLLLPPSSSGCRGHCPSVALSAYQAAGEITPTCLCVTDKPFNFERCMVSAPPAEEPLWWFWKAGASCPFTAQQSYFTPSEVFFSLLFPLFIHMWIQWDLTWLSHIHTIKFTVLWWLINEFYS